MLVAPLVVLLLRSPLPAAGRPLLAGLLPPLGVALLAFGVLGLLAGRPAAYGADGLLGACALLTGAAVAQRAQSEVPPDRVSQPCLHPHLPRV